MKGAPITPDWRFDQQCARCGLAGDRVYCLIQREVLLASLDLDASIREK